MSKINEALDIANDLDSKGLQKEADIIDYLVEEIVVKTAAKGLHKSGLKETTVEQHRTLLENYKKAMENYEKEYSKLMKSNNETDSPNQGLLREITSNYAHNCNAVRFHEMYFEDVIDSNPYPANKDPATEAIFKELYKTGLNGFKKELKRMAKVSRNGWVILNFCTMSKELYLDIVDLHDQHVIACSLPVMCLDMWEHAYYADFGLDKEAYVDWFLSRLNFKNIRNRVKNFQRIK